MISSLSLDTQVALLLTGPLIAGRNDLSQDLLTPGEYNRLEKTLLGNQRLVPDLLGSDASELIEMCQSVVDGERVKRLLGRGFLLSQAIEQWQARSIWVISRADPHYPTRLKKRLREYAPPILYGCGDETLLDSGGLAIVGSRHVDDALVAYTENIGRLAAQARCTVVSGGARGIDQAAMRGALMEEGRVSGILSDSLERAALIREHREVLMDKRLVLISPYDPAAGFNVGNAMQRNKLIYALADAALVVSSDFEKGGTWAGAVEQLGKWSFVPVYVRFHGEIGKGLKALRQKGALAWPNPSTIEKFNEALSVQRYPENAMEHQGELPFMVAEESTQ